MENVNRKGRFGAWQFISQGQTPGEHLFYILLALEGGCKWIQLRIKDQAESVIIQTAQKAKVLCAVYGARFMLNDYLHLVEKVGADGVHLGLLDASVKDAKNILGGDRIIGGTANTCQDVWERITEGVDYIGLGPFQFTKTKEKLSPVLGYIGYKSVVRDNRTMAVGQGVVVPPIFAIGGVLPEHMEELFRTGIDGLAISGWVCRQVDLRYIAGQLMQSLSIDNVEDFYHTWAISFPAQYHAVIGNIGRFAKRVESQVVERPGEVGFEQIIGVY